MIVKDINQTLNPPADFDLYDVRADGAFLRLEYNKTKFVEDPTDKCTGQKAEGWTSVILYLNDQGREVIRTEQYIAIAPQLPPVSVTAPTPWYFVWADAVLRFFHLD